jgi:hypothetical protein
MVVKTCAKSWYFVHSLISTVKTFWVASKIIYPQSGDKNSEEIMTFPGEEGRDSYENIDEISTILRSLSKKQR